ncbi:metallophosphoesterase [Streptomyces flavofungini]|uniref:Metallophosphoesterase n=1 Tax=Streptomyces flavofungini TaxID=68200 RepID=A0ABS0X5C5_9ACTN|nr:metallophosphoesterase [Streptomyces flavofungini]MBJ3808393.1 metallophosphoesterase [Streptomyces flavofungini]GHC69345.1 membrane protein [Streptomyces flavofungini]
MGVLLGVLIGAGVIAAFGGLLWYVWRRVVRDTTRPRTRWRRIGTVVFFAGPVLMFAALAAERGGAPFLLQQVLAWPGFLWMAFALYLLLALVAGEAVRPLLRRWLTSREPSLSVPAPDPARPALEGEPDPARPALEDEARKAGEAGTGAQPHQPEGPHRNDPEGARRKARAEPRKGEAGDLTRRLFVSRAVAGAAVTAAAATVGYGTYNVLKGPRIKRVTVPLAKLPRAAHGYRIAVVSDIHLSPVLGESFARRVVDTVNSTQPDLIAVVGDLVDGDVADLAGAARPLADLRARQGAFFVTGNHEYFSGADQWVDHVRELGLRPLENARTELPYFDLAGVNDVQGEGEGEGPDFAKALGDRDRTRTSVLMAHQPVVIHDAVEHGVDLQLSGHTHGGQLWPNNFIADLANPTLAGLERYGDTQLYVTRGAGAWGPPVRVGAPSDITVVELASPRA